jgi:hypothetical protein
MRKFLVFTGKTLVLFLTTFLAFIAIKNLIGAVGMGDMDGIPSSLVAAYGPSVFVRNNMLAPAFFTMIITIVVHMFVCFLVLEKGMRQKKILKGLLFGAAFGALWAFGFLELAVVFKSDLSIQIKSAIRDASAFAVFGSLAGILFGSKTAISEPGRKNGPLAVALCALGFALFHGIQYRLAFPAIETSMNSGFSVLWLLCAGGWIGFMYLLMIPGIKKRGRYFNVLFFTVAVVGIDWTLFTFFFNLYLDIPVIHLVIRCLFDLAGIALGLSAYEFIDDRLRKRG